MERKENEIAIQRNEHDLIMRARQLIAAEREEEALQVVRQVLRANPNHFVALLLYGQLTPDSERAIKVLKKVLTIDPRNVEAKIQLRILQNSNR